MSTELENSKKQAEKAQEKSGKGFLEIRYYVRPEIAELFSEFSDIEDEDILNCREKLLKRLLLIEIP